MGKWTSWRDIFEARRQGWRKRTLRKFAASPLETKTSFTAVSVPLQLQDGWLGLNDASTNFGGVPVPTLETLPMPFIQIADWLVKEGGDGVGGELEEEMA
uniref:Uncharacterized protein n=1 Tax=Chromera velia CCMP2878 TaxID=1169474 RepID=A0A0G4FW79_9ALVE|eukprot:Cvel_19052.t1-p1 / transcript=Cvel_19052.t1 / gene=Cvel_19052 / organism=Chromera_velia_CCMP2878 / gene_product=hypothetical protein / transcript_product=hypothetical protein / location=Cvel_scaffold1615:32237-32533(-) / protein_length=99 / sequence_SO=supercontig / SO=protein_coding / is_pseudo=false